MEYQLLSQNQCIVRLTRGEKLVESLKKLVEKVKIEGGVFFGLGAVDQLEIAHYNVSDKKYSNKKIEKALEITNLSGTIGWLLKGDEVQTEELVVHVHGSFSDVEMNMVGGHIVERRVSGTLEIWIQTTNKLIKKIHPETGLKIFSLAEEIK